MHLPLQCSPMRHFGHHRPARSRCWHAPKAIVGVVQHGCLIAAPFPAAEQCIVHSCQASTRLIRPIHRFVSHQRQQPRIWWWWAGHCIWAESSTQSCHSLRRLHIRVPAVRAVGPHAGLDARRCKWVPDQTCLSTLTRLAPFPVKCQPRSAGGIPTHAITAGTPHAPLLPLP